MRGTRILKPLALVAAVGAAALVAVVARPSEAGAPTGSAALFETSSPLRAADEARPLALFDKARLPEDYETCYKEFALSDHLKITRPYAGSSYPPGIAAPEFRWEDRADNLWLVRLNAPGLGKPFDAVTAERKWRPDAALWERIKSAGAEGWVTLEVRGIRLEKGAREGDAVYADSVTFHTSKYPTDPYVVYRLVTPFFHAYKTPDVKWRDVRSFDTGLFYPGDGAYCTNCHSFPGSPELQKKDLDMAIAVRKQLGSERYRILGLYNFQTRVGKTLGINSFFMSWDPLGTKMLLTAGVNTYVKPLITLETQEFLVKEADIVVVDTDTLEYHPLPGASTKEYMETFPTWSPDGKTILFSRAVETGDEWYKTKFNIYRLPFNDGKGGTPEPMKGASDNGLSNYFPRFSPDGKWIVFDRADWSSLVAPTSDLYIVPNDPNAEPRELECNDPYSMDSYHSWSSNSRWLLFAAKRDDGIFARLYLTEIDENGHASPPIEMPLPEEKFGIDDMMCYNVPEFMKYDVPIDGWDILKKTGHLEAEKKD